MHRRNFLSLLGAPAAAWPLVARAQQRERRVIGFLYGDRDERSRGPLAAFRRGLSDSGFVVGENVTIEFRGANSQFAKLPALAAELVQRQVDVIFAASSIGPARAAKAATATIPIVFNYGGDPVKDGLVASLNSPGGNVTGVTGLQTELANKRFGLLHELIPSARTIAFLTGSTEPMPDHGVLVGARALGLDVVAFQARNNGDFERAFATFAERAAGALIIDNNALLISNFDSIIKSAERYKIPAIYPGSFFVRRGGLMSYGTDVLARYHQAAFQYVAQILKGTKPADLPVQQPTKFELVINMKTAKALGLAVPMTLRAVADELIE